MPGTFLRFGLNWCIDDPVGLGAKLKETTATDIERGASAVAAVAGASHPLAGVFAAFAKEMLGLHLQRKAQEAEQVLLDEIQRADAWDRLKSDPESTAARTVRYVRAASVGAAYENLRLLARLVVYGDGSRAIVPDDFLYLSQAIESLRHDEMVVHAAFIRRKQIGGDAVDHGLQMEVLADLKGTYDESEIWSLMGSLLRTGLIYTTTGFGGGAWNTSPILIRLEETIQFADAVARAQAARAA